MAFSKTHPHQAWKVWLHVLYGNMTQKNNNNRNKQVKQPAIVFIAGEQQSPERIFTSLPSFVDLKFF
jgi:hypothetical protein